MEKIKNKKNRNNRTREVNFSGFWVRLWKLLEPSHKKIINLLAVVSAVEVIRLIGPYIFKLIIDKITDFNVAQLDVVLGLIVLMFLINEGMSLIDYFADRRTFDLLTGAVEYLSNNAQKKMIFLSLGYHEKENTGAKVVKVSRGVDKIENLFGNFFWEVAPTIFQVILTTATLFWIGWQFGFIILIFVPIFVFLTLQLNAKVFPFRQIRYDEQEVAAGLMTQSIININTVKSFVQELREYNQFAEATRKVKNSVLKEYGKVLKYNLARNLVIDLGRGCVLFSGIYLVAKGHITIGSLVFVYTISEKALLSLFRISRLYDRIMESSEAVDRLYDLSLEETESRDLEAGLKPRHIEGSIEFKNVSYTYQESSLKALDKVSFKISPSCVTALVGPSGGGKTTVVRMIYRHYDPTKGEIILDGKNLKDYNLYGFRKFIAIVPQEVEMFDTTVKENIAYAKPKATLAEIKAAARIANAEEFIANLTDGYDTLVGERGIKLSGGQRQRIGIARSILANPRILIFDEATSNLDSYSEHLIQDAMEKISQNRTVIIIAHRLSTIKKADKIVVLEHGRVMEEGSHTELAQIEGGLYKKLIDLQRMGDVTS
ncbi:MAG: ABC transporter ATP-binding protein [Parcubacteria group bacterium]